MNRKFKDKNVQFYKIDVCEIHCLCDQCKYKYECRDDGVCEYCGESGYFIGECDKFEAKNR